MVNGLVGEQIGRYIVIISLQPVFLDGFFELVVFSEAFAFHRQEVEEGGHIGGPHLVAGDNLVEAGDVRKMAEKICYLIENRDVRESMGQAAIARAGMFSRDQVMHRWIELFESL